MSKRHGAIRCVADIQEIADLKKRVEELAIELQKERERLAAYSQVHLRQVSKLQAARELASRIVSLNQPVGSREEIKAQARDFLKMLEGIPCLLTRP